MEYRKYNHTPRERITDEMLLSILEEDEPVRFAYGNGCNNTVTGQRGQRYVSSRMEITDDGNGNGNAGGCCEVEKCAKTNSLSGYALAMVYTPDQEWQELYSDEDAMSHGTLFCELFKPFYHGCSGNCR